MNQTPVAQIAVERHILLSQERAHRLSYLAQARGVGENQIVEKALDIFFSLADLLDERSERQGWSALSEPSLRRVWDNEQDAAYDKYKYPGDLLGRETPQPERWGLQTASSCNVQVAVSHYLTD